jgi:hypothetical protein
MVMLETERGRQGGPEADNHNPSRRGRKETMVERGEGHQWIKFSLSL